VRSPNEEVRVWDPEQTLRIFGDRRITRSATQTRGVGMRGHPFSIGVPWAISTFWAGHADLRAARRLVKATRNLRGTDGSGPTMRSSFRRTKKFEDRRCPVMGFAHRTGPVLCISVLWMTVPRRGRRIWRMAAVPICSENPDARESKGALHRAASFSRRSRVTRSKIAAALHRRGPEIREGSWAGRSAALQASFPQLP
jgi:hypothetical protein